MKRLIIISMLLLAAVFTISAVPQQPKGWEYKFQYRCDEKKTNSLAAEGWELTSFTSSYLNAGAGSIDTCIFKRAK